MVSNPARERAGRSRWLLLAVAAVLVTVATTAFGATSPGVPLTFSAAAQLPGAAAGTEPQIAVAPDGTRYAVSAGDVTSSSSLAVVKVYSSSASDGPWTLTPGQISGARDPSADVAIAVSTTGRITVIEEDSAVLSFVANYSDNGGRTWTQSTGLQQLVDQDRPWLTAGPHDTMSLLFHNGFSSNATQNMFVENSTDGGATFGVPVPITLPGTPEFADLQCADSGGPSALLVSPTSGRLYAIWGTRHGPLGGCGLLPLTPFTLVPADRVWVATSPTGAAGTWTSDLAVDDSATTQVVGMQLSPAALDSAGNIWLAWNTPPNGYPDDSGAGISIREGSPTLSTWTDPVSVVDPGGTGHVLAQLVAGAPGRLGLLYLTGMGSGAAAKWYPQASIITGATGEVPAVTTNTLLNAPSYHGTATDLMGSGCDPSSSPVGTVENNPVTCARSADVLGIALDKSCRVVVSWPSISLATDAFLGGGPDATWIATQSSGESLCAADETLSPLPTSATKATATVVKSAPRKPVRSTHRRTGPAKGAAHPTSAKPTRTLASTGLRLLPLGLLALLLLGAAAVLQRRLHRH